VYSKYCEAPRAGLDWRYTNVNIIITSQIARERFCAKTKLLAFDSNKTLDFSTG